MHAGIVTKIGLPARSKGAKIFGVDAICYVFVSQSNTCIDKKETCKLQQSALKGSNQAIF